MTTNVVFGAIQTQTISASLIAGNSATGAAISVSTIPGNKTDVGIQIEFDSTVGSTAGGQLEVYLNGDMTTAVSKHDDAWPLVEVISGGAATGTDFGGSWKSLAGLGDGVLPDNFRVRVINNMGQQIDNVTLRYRSVATEDV